jgi:hypothetical protein
MSVFSDLIENFFNNYLFPDLSRSCDTPIHPRVPVMHNQTRQELYHILILLSKSRGNYAKIIELLEDIIPQGMALLINVPRFHSNHSIPLRRLHLCSKLVFRAVQDYSVTGGIRGAQKFV